MNHFSDGESLQFTFRYDVQANHVTRTIVDRSDGQWTRYEWGPDSYAVRETHGVGQKAAEFTYDRDPVTNVVTSLAVTCPDRRGQPLRHSAVVRSGDDESVKANILQTHCHWTEPWRRAASQ